MESTMVIKVKYGDTLRRFNAVVDEYGKLHLNMAGLRSKILGLFNLTLETDITMKYVDEDGDLVTLVEDEDLHDVMRQRLKFLRIDVQVNGEKGSNYARSSRTSTPLSTNASVSEVLKSEEDQLKEIVEKLSPALVSEDTSANLRLAKLINFLPEMRKYSPPSPLYTSLTRASNVSEDVSFRRLRPKSSSGGSTPSIKEASIDDVTKCMGSNSSPPLMSSHNNYAPFAFNLPSDKGKSQFNPSPKPSKECPFSRVTLGNGSTVPPHPPLHLLNRRSVANIYGAMVHMGIGCDGCRICPITGPRYKSKVKEDYDLCSVCFVKMGNDEDYIIMDRPMSCRNPPKRNAIYDHTKNVSAGSFPPLPAKCGLKSLHPRLDSHFISDMTVRDGTVMAPSTPFTKIWRMQNNGNFVWLRGTKLIWICGDKLTDVVSIELEVPENGVPLDGQVDIAVDFTAPEVPGRYISHWKMASSTGLTFGERVWVSIEVESSLKDSVCDNVGGLNLNLPPDCSEAKSPVMLEDPVSDCLSESTSSNKEMEPPKHDHDVNFSINDSLLVGQGASAPPESPSHVSEASHVSYPIIDTVIESPASPLTSDEDNVVEQTMLKELEEMGFKQVDLNKEILRYNEYNLELSVDQLCGVGEWDPMLEELEEMGFCDTETNKRLLEKNNGSIKRVVMDLINGHNE